MPSLITMRPSPQSVAADEDYSPASASCDSCFRPQSATFCLPANSSLDRKEEELTRQLSAMLRRERSPDLRPRDYLGLLSLSSHCSRDEKMTIDRTCRTKMVRWMYNVVDYCDFDRECAYVATSHLDRFLSSSSPAAVRASRDKRMYQLAAVSSLYLAIKTVESRTVLSPEGVSDISDGEYAEEEIVTMECDILRALQWRVHAPTATEFASYLLALWDFSHSDAHLRQQQHRNLMEIVRYQVELSTLDYKSSLSRPSVVAVAALCNALNCEGLSHEIESFLRSVGDIASEEFSFSQVRSVRDRLARMLRKALQQGAEGGNGDGSSMAGSSSSSKRPPATDAGESGSGKKSSKISATGEHLSPVCVSSHVNHRQGQTCQ